MRAKNNPSYLFKSPEDIYYFRVRIPSFIRNLYSTSKVEVRKSLQTRDYATALRKSRCLWVEMEDTDYGLLSFGTYEYRMKKSIEQELQEANEGRKLLKLLFSNEIYEKGRLSRAKSVNKQPSRYWLPLLALFTGARGEEFSQLYTDDIQKDEKTGIYFIELKENKERNQGLKNKSAPRKILVHQQLIKLGFLDFIRRGKKPKMLFPELDNGKRKYYKSFGNNFNRRAKNGWKWKLGVKSKKTSFHSFRHNVVDFFAKSEIPVRISCAIVGHQYSGKGLVANYIKSEELKGLQDAVNQLRFPSIDWKKIEKRRW